jgi:amidase
MGLQRDWGAWLADHPLVLGPVFSDVGTAPDQDIASLEDHRRIGQALALCSATSYLGLPAVSVPVGLAGRRPLGVQLIGPSFREDLCLEAAGVLEAALGRI